VAKNSGLKVGALAAFVILICTAVPAAAAPQSFDWAYTGLDGAGCYAPRRRGLPGRPITGTHNDVAITGFPNYAIPSQLVYAASTYLDCGGLAFVDASGDAFDAFYDTATNDPYNCGYVGYCEIGPGLDGTDGLGPPRDPVNSIDFTLRTVRDRLASHYSALDSFGGCAASQISQLAASSRPSQAPRVYLPHPPSEGLRDGIAFRTAANPRSA
jgi:hypothetical protein